MAKNIREFIEENIKKGQIKRDLFIGEGVDKTYLEPLIKAWKDYSIRKRDIILLSIIISQKYHGKLDKKDMSEERNIKSTKPIDMGRLADFTDEELTFLLSILIYEFGVDEAIDGIQDKWEHLREMAEEGIRILYYKIYKEKLVDTEIFNTILDLDGELKIK